MKENTEAFHDKHEHLTEVIYNTPGMLPSRYVFVLTTRCNLSCSFCYQSRRSRNDRMGKEDWIRLGRQLPDYARVTMTGGEPFLLSGFREVFSFIVERFDCNIITNGVLLDEALIDFLLSRPKFRVLSVSIDDAGNRLRGVSPGKWKKTEAMLHFFADRRKQGQGECILDAKTTVLDQNASDLFEIHRYCVEELPCDHHSFQFLKGSSLQHADEMFPFEDIFRKTKAPVYRNFEIIVEQLEKVRRYNREKGKKAFIHPKVTSLNDEKPLSHLDYLNQPYHIKEQFEPCKYPWSSVHINADGSLFPCLAVSMGNVRKTPLEEIIIGEVFARFRGLIGTEGTVAGCNRCGWLKPAP